jgi:hypothetical protein
LNFNYCFLPAFPLSGNKLLLTTSLLFKVSVVPRDDPSTITNVFGGCANSGSYPGQVYSKQPVYVRKVITRIVHYTEGRYISAVYENVQSAKLLHSLFHYFFSRLNIPAVSFDRQGS